MYLKDLTQDDLRVVLELYAKYLGGRGVKDYLEDPFIKEGLPSNIERLLKALRTEGTQDNREGSRFDRHTKLEFKVLGEQKRLVIDVNLNFNPNERKGRLYEEAKTARRQFLEEVMRYFDSRETC